MPGKRVLLIEDDGEYERLVRAVLAACGGAFELNAASSLAAGLALLEEFSPQLVLLDLNLPDSSGYGTFLRVRERAQGTPIVVLTGVDDDHLAIRAVEDGAQDYIVKNLIQPRLIARRINMALSRQKNQAASMPPPPSEPGTVLGFVGSKGGVGTSTVALNVAAVLAQNGLKTIVIELQQGRPGTLSLYSHAEPLRGLNSLLKTASDAIAPADVQPCLAEALSGLYLLCPTASAGIWRTLGAAHAHAIIAAARRMVPFVVLDLPSRIDEGVAEALKLSDAITMIVDREAASVHCATSMLEQIRLGVSRKREVQLVLTDRTALEAPLTLEDIKKELKMHPLVIIPAAAAAIALSHAARMPLTLLYPDDSFGSAHFELAERLLSLAGSVSHRCPTPGRLLNRTVSWNTIPETTYS